MDQRNLLSRSAISEIIRDQNVRVGRDFLGGLNEVVYKFVEDAVTRAKGNNRRTVRLIDLSLLHNVERALAEPKKDGSEKVVERPRRAEGGSNAGSNRLIRRDVTIRKVAGPGERAEPKSS